MRTGSSPLQYFKYLFLLSAAAALAAWVLGRPAWIGPALIATFTSLALYFMGHLKLKSFAFTIWVFASVSASMTYPEVFLTWFEGTRLELKLSIFIGPLIQIIMFGMGTTLSVVDFARVLKMPWAVFVGLVLQFSVMPLAGYMLAEVFGFDAAVAAGVILIGSCPGGVASNLMTYLARGNVALSVTMTSCSTLLSPLMTPFLMQLLAGDRVPVKFFAMMFEILNLIIVPIVAGLIANRILYSRHRGFNHAGVLAAIAAVGIIAGLAVARFAPSAVFTFHDAAFSKAGFVVGLLLIGVVALAKLVVSIWLKRPENWMDKALPLVSMVGICVIIAIITAGSAEKLMKVGIYVIGAAILHNFIGYTLGYWLARAARLDESACRTVAFEVGMQNGGMASGLATNPTLFADPSTALAPAIFGPWMNVSGSVLATWWHRKPVPIPGHEKSAHDSGSELAEQQ